MREFFSPEKLNRFLFVGSTLCCSLVVVPVINFWFTVFDPIEAGDVIVNESVWLSRLTVPISVTCFILVYFLFSRREGGFIFISVAGFAFSLSTILTVAQLFSRFNKPWEDSKFWPFLGFSLAAGIVVSLGTMSVLTFVRWRIIRFVSEHKRLP